MKVDFCSLCVIVITDTKGDEEAGQEKETEGSQRLEQVIPSLFSLAFVSLLSLETNRSSEERKRGKERKKETTKKTEREGQQNTHQKKSGKSILS